MSNPTGSARGKRGARHRAGISVGTIPAGGRRFRPFFPTWSKRSSASIRRNWQRRHRGCGRTGSGQQRISHRHTRSVAHPGLPTTATAAIILAAFQQWGLQPGTVAVRDPTPPDLGPHRQHVRRQRHPLVLNLPLIGIWVKLLEIRRPLLYAGILIFATLGAYGLRNSWFDLALLYIIGVIGFLMRRYDIPVAPVLVGRSSVRSPSSSSAVRSRSARATCRSSSGSRFPRPCSRSRRSSCSGRRSGGESPRGERRGRPRAERVGGDAVRVFE